MNLFHRSLFISLSSRIFFRKSTNAFSLLLWCLVSIYSVSCTSTKNIQYFQDLPDSSTIRLEPMKGEPRTIDKGDRLLITFGSRDAEAAAVFNRYGGVSLTGSEFQGTAGADVAGFIVDDNGFLEFPFIGKIKSEGLTVSQLKDTLTKKAGLYLRDPYIVVRFIDFKVTVLGEVRLPGTYSLPQNKPSLLQALGASGDLARSAKRYDIQLLRDYNGERTVTRVDMRSKNILNNPQSFLLQNNDVIYVQPRKGGLIGENFGIVTGILSVIISLATLMVTINK